MGSTVIRKYKIGNWFSIQSAPGYKSLRLFRFTVGYIK